MIKTDNGLYKIESEALNNWLDVMTGEEVPLGQPRSIDILVDEFSEANLPDEPSFKEFVETYDGSKGPAKAILNRMGNGFIQNWQHTSNIAVTPNENIKELTIYNSTIRVLDLEKASGLMGIDLQHNHMMRKISGLDEKGSGQLALAKILDNSFRYDPEKLLENNPGLGTAWSKPVIDLMTVAENPHFMERFNEDEDFQNKVRVQESVSDCTYTEYSAGELIRLDSILEDRYANLVTDDMTKKEILLAVLLDARDVNIAETDAEGHADHENLNEDQIASLHGLKFLLQEPGEDGTVCSGMSHLAKWMGEKAGIKVDLVNAYIDFEMPEHDPTVRDRFFSEYEYADHMMVRVEVKDSIQMYADIMNPGENLDQILVSQGAITSPSFIEATDGFLYDGKNRLEPSEIGMIQQTNYSLKRETVYKLKNSLEKKQCEHIPSRMVDKLLSEHLNEQACDRFLEALGISSEEKAEPEIV